MKIEIPPPPPSPQINDEYTRKANHAIFPLLYLGGGGGGGG